MKFQAAPWCAAAALLIMTAGCAAPEDPAMRPYRVNPISINSPEVDKIKYPPGGGTSAYWLDGRFNLTLDNFTDESVTGDKAIFRETICFRQEGAKVYATNKTNEWFVLDLTALTFKKSTDISAFAAEDQAILLKLKSHASGNHRIDPDTLMPRM